LPVPGQEFGDAPRRMIGDAGEQVGDVVVWVESVELGALKSRSRSPRRGRRRHPTRPHDARSLGHEVTVAYPFHPLFGRPAIVVADQLHNGSRHLTLRSGDEPSFLVPAWMVDPSAAAVKIVDVPCLFCCPAS